MNIYLKEETDFKHNGLGFLTDVLKANVTDNLNGDYSLSFEYKINGNLSEYIQNENIIKCKVADGSKQLFVIKKVVKTFSSIQVNCKHIFYKLLDNFLEDTAPTNLSPQPFLTWILDRTNYQNDFTVYSDISMPRSARYVRKNPVDCILGDTYNSMVNLFGGELKRDNFNIHFNKKIGNDNGVKLTIGKNITGINITVDTNSVHTRIMPQGFDGLMLPEKYVDSPLINIYPEPKIYKVEFNDIKYDPEYENAYHSEEEAYNALRIATNELFNNGIDKPEINIKVDWLELSKTNEYKSYSKLEEINLGDTTTIDLLGISYKARIIKTVYNPLIERIETFEIGTPKANIGTSTNLILKEVEKINPTSILESAKNNATQMLAKAMGGYVYKTQNELFIMDSDIPENATKIWRWNMNGLGYSSNGINGPYETAMTSDGKIVADFITTGKLNTNVIEGYNDLLLSISNIKDVTKKIERSNFIETLDAVKGSVIRLSIKGNMSLLFPSNQTFLSNQTFFRNSKLIVEDENGNIKEYETGLKYLNSFEGVYDEFVVDENGVYIIRRIGINENSSFYVLENQTIEKLPIIQIELNDGYNKIYMSSFENLDYELKYAIKNDYTDVFAKKIEMNSMLSMQEENIDLKLIKKVDNDNIIAQINMSTEKDNDGSLIQIEADKLNLKGKKINLTSDEIEIASTNFSVDKNGNMRANDGYFSGNIELTDDSVNSKLTIKSKTDSQTANSATLEAIGNHIFIKSDDVGGSYQNFGLHRGIPSMTMTEENKYYTWLSATNLMFNKYSDNSSSSFSASGLYFDKGSTRKIGINADDGNISCVSLTQTSLADKKKNFELLDNALEIIKKTDIYKYHLKNQKNDEKKRIGFVIGDDFNYSKEITSLANDGVDIYSMVSVVFKAVKEQQLIIENLEKKINELEEKISGNNN